jgi:hypothetical protein
VQCSRQLTDRLIKAAEEIHQAFFAFSLLNRRGAGKRVEWNEEATRTGAIPFKAEALT